MVRLAKYLYHHREEVIQTTIDRGSPGGETPAYGENILLVEHDSDWAGSSDLKSTSGVRIMLISMKIYSSSITQSGLPALSSGEAELCSMAKAVVDAQYIRDVAREMGIELSIVKRTDSAAALANASKLGPGRIRHLELQAACLKECVRKRYVRIEKMSGKDNTSDILTKHYNAEVIRRMRPKIGIITSVSNYVEVPFTKVNDWKDIIPFPDTDPTTEKYIRERFGVKLPDATETTVG